jgi:Holliday junction DNA helicase RuvA
MPAASRRFPGIGKKTAERLLLELKDKLGADVTTTVGVHRPPPASADVLHALLALGYSDRKRSRRSRRCRKAWRSGDGIRQALKVLAKV